MKGVTKISPLPLHTNKTQTKEIPQFSAAEILNLLRSRTSDGFKERYSNQPAKSSTTVLYLSALKQHKI